MSKVSRSVYQKVCEENKRLKKDIKLLVSEGVTFDKLDCIQKWREKIKEERDFLDMLKEGFNAMAKAGVEFKDLKFL